MMYLIQVNILLVVFYGIYQLLFVRDTFLRGEESRCC